LRVLKNYDEKSSRETSKTKHCQQIAFVDDQFLDKFNSDFLMHTSHDAIFVATAYVRCLKDKFEK